MTQTQLFFGRGNASDEEWNNFQKTVLTEKFASGYTVVNTGGSWKDSKGVIHAERGKLVIRLHDSLDADELSITAVIDTYKRQYDQQSVLRVDSKSCATF